MEEITGIRGIYYRRGLEQGEKQASCAEKRGIQKVLASQLRLKFGTLSESVQQRLEQAENEQLERWAGAILTAESLDEVFAS